MKVSKAIRDNEEALVLRKRKWVDASMQVNVLNEMSDLDCHFDFWHRRWRPW